MNKGTVIGIIALVILTAGWFILSTKADKDTMAGKDAMVPNGGAVMEKEEGAVEGTPTEGAMEKKDDAVMQKDARALIDKGEVMPKVGSYEAYSTEKVAKAANGDVVLFFRASWCPTCRAADADIRAHLNDIPADLTILDVNYDESSALKAKYGVTYQHTFVQVDAQGNQIKKWSGSATLAALVAEVK